MREIPPDSTLARLIELQLCAAADVQRARRIVRRMTRDLPAFDSVWVDALTQLRALTPFQARMIDEGRADSLRVGPYILVDGLGGGVNANAFLATGPDRRRIVLNRIGVTADQATETVLRLELLIERFRQIDVPQIAVYTKLVQMPAAVFIAGQHVPGMDLRELLTRRGRFPAEVVLAVADHLLTGLAAVHAVGITHGDLRLTKIRLTARGQIVLVDTGILPAVSPEVMVHTVTSPELADVIAPERIGTNQPATAASDLYAVGCVLWHLLAGRPPHPQADPLTKLAAHQNRRIPDVREFAPETPVNLAHLIQRLTSLSPLHRPSSAELARRELGLRQKPAQRKLARFRRQFDSTVPHLATRPVRRRQWAGVVAAAVMLGAIAVGLSDRGLRTQLLEIAQKLESVHEPVVQSSVEPTGFQKIPAPDARGVITLTQAGPYAAEELSGTGILVLQAAPNIRPRIRIQSQPLQITAQQIVLKNIDLDGTPADSTLDALASLQSQRIQIQGCRFLSTATRDSNPPPATHHPQLTAIAWRSGDRRDPQAGLLTVENTVFQGEMQGLSCEASPRRIVWRNVLKTDAGVALAIQTAAATTSLDLSLSQVTLRGSGPVLSCRGPLVEEASAAVMELEAMGCVFDVSASVPLVELRGPKVRPDWPQAVRFVGDGSLIRPETTLLAHVDPEQSLNDPLEHDEMQFEGLFIDEFEFTDAAERSADGSALAKTNAPRRQSDRLPGINPSKLPQ